MKGIEMKTRIQYRLIIRPSVTTMLALSIAFTQWVHISRGSEAPAFNVKTKPSATYQPDDVEGVVQAAKAGISSLNASNSARVNEVNSALETFAAAVAGQQNFAALAAVAAEMKALAEKIQALRNQINALRNEIENL